MAHTQHFFNPNASSPLVLAEQNQCFYIQFVAEYGCCKANAYLWTGLQLQSLIEALQNYVLTVASTCDKIKCNANISFYKNLYKKLTNQNFSKN